MDDRRDGSEVGTGIGIGIGMVIWTDLRLGSLELLGDWGDVGSNARPRGVSDPGRASPALIVLVLVRFGVELDGEDRSMGGARLEASAAAASRADDVVEQNDARFAGGRSEDRRSG